ncbi:MAG: hypothetical protein JSW11_16645 [Candidatus Heimdallarchaeota archaeon]|nr:MAG: hypothetical protein JSW11_16645 [Candidatus Heimdallarchaeota archaeon]
MSDDFSSSISLLADLELHECSKCKKPTESTKLDQGLCPECKKKARKRSASIIPDKKKGSPKVRKSKSSKTLKELETRILKQQTLIESLKSKNEELESQTFELMDRIRALESGTTSKGAQEKIVIAYYSFEKKYHEFFTATQVTDQLLLKMILLIETSLNSAEQIQALEIIGNNFLQDGRATPKGDIRDYIRVSAASFTRSFLPFSNDGIRNLGIRSFHCEILLETYTEDLIPVYTPTTLGERFFTIKSNYFNQTQVMNRIKTSFGRHLITNKGRKLYKVIFDHYIENKRPVTRQELFNNYNLGKYEIDNFKHNLIEIGLIKKVPLPITERYNQNRQIPRSEIPLQPRHLTIPPKDLAGY